VPEEQRNEVLFRAIYIGVLALMEDRLSSFLATTSNELGTRLESLKMIFDMKKELFFKSAVKGMFAEGDVVAFLNQHFQELGWGDQARQTGTDAGTMAGNKTGDVLCTVEGSARTIAIEVKFDKSYKLGDIQDKDIFTKKAETAWSQILEAKANRDSRVGIIVFDRSLVDAGIARAAGGSVGFIRGVGFVVIVDAQAGNFSNLAIAYALARDIVLNAKDLDPEAETLLLLVKRVLHDLQTLVGMKKHLEAIKKSAQALDEDLAKGTLSMRFTLKYLERFLETGQLTKKDLFDFYAGEEVKAEFGALELKDGK
jgi:hypothetical protein